MRQTLWNRLNWTKTISSFPTLALLLCASGAFAAAPSVVADVQVAGPSGLNGPQSIVVAPNNSYYVADAGNNRVLVYVNGSPSTVATGAFTLVTPQALALDAAGDLFIGDSPTPGTGRVLEALATNGVLNGTVNLLVSGGGLEDVTALTVDTTAGSSTFGTVYIGDDVSNSIYTVAAGSTTLVKLNVTGLPSDIIPTALAKDAAGNVYVADLNSTLYEIPSGTTAAQIYSIPNFVIWGPTGLAFDHRGNFYILTLTDTAATPSQPVPENIIEVPGGDVSSAFRVPFTGSQNASGLGFDSYGTLYLLDFVNGNVTELLYGAPANLGRAAVNSGYGPFITFNYEMNASFQQGGFQVVSEGDPGPEATNASNTCQNLIFTDGSNGGAISPSNPFLCEAQWVATPAYPGLRYGAVKFLGTGGFTLASVPVYSTGLAGASVVYPLTPARGARNINQPQGLAVSGLDQSLYVADSGTPAQILKINGPAGRTKTKVSTAPVTLQAPGGIAINGQGDLYIADLGPQFTPGQIVVVPALKGKTPFVLNLGAILQHPVAAAFDTRGNLLIGDAGPAWLNASPDNPGYILEVPAGGGAAFKLNTGSVTISFPQTIAVDPYTNDLYVGDGGDSTGAFSQVVHVPAGGGGATVVTPAGITNPVGIVFDPAEQYYILDGNAKTITAVPPSGAPFQVPFDSTLLDSPSALAITNGGQSFVVANGGNPGANDLVFLNGTTSTLAFGNVVRNQQSPTMTSSLVNIGSTGLTLDTPYFTANRPNAQFTLLNSTTCANGLLLAPAGQCNINVQFQPTRLGNQAKTLTFQTDGYRPSVSVLKFSGTGVPPS